MTIKNISKSKNITIKTENNTVYLVEIRTFLGTTVFKDYINPINKIIKIKGLNPGKYTIQISNDKKLTNQQIHIE